MNIKEICNGVYYVGVNDMTTTRFEGLWSLPKGVSYNSYIVKGTESTALIDTVAVGGITEFIENILRVADAPSYLIVNHMEPDHSGGIPSIVARFPNIKIVADKLAINMIKGFYHIDDDDRFIEVTDGSKLDLGGGKTLSFHTIPMVHWPETMVTYLASEEVLFSGDAFGTFGVLNGTPDDDSLDFDFYEPEMRRYYAAIVGKYSPFVQKALAKLQGIPVSYICDTHGPVWHRHAARVIELYDKMSRQEQENGVVIVYGSMYGNTQRMAFKFASLLSERGVKVARVFNASETELSIILADVWRYKGLVVASPTYSMDIFPVVESFIKALEIREIKNKVTASLGSYAWAPRIAADKIEQRLSLLGLQTVGKVSMPMSPNKKTDDELTVLADEFAKAMKA